MQEPEMQDPEMTAADVGDHESRDDDRERLFSSEDGDVFERRWTEVQTHFVDDPERAVQDADRLVTEVMERLTARFAEQKRALDQQWSSGDAVETEDLRLAMTRYREFFRRLLAT